MASWLTYPAAREKLDQQDRERWTGRDRWDRERMAVPVLTMRDTEEALPRCPANISELEIQSSPSDVRKNVRSCTLDPSSPSHLVNMAKFSPYLTLSIFYDPDFLKEPGQLFWFV